MKLKLVFALAIGIAALVPAFNVTAEEKDPIAERQAAMKQLGKALKTGDLPTVAAKAGELKLLFPEGSMSDMSEASPKIWEEWDEFIAIFDKLEEDANAGASPRDIGGSCKACHDKYRVKKG